jgi:hypothetical protein
VIRIEERRGREKERQRENRVGGQENTLTNKKPETEGKGGRGS